MARPRQDPLPDIPLRSVYGRILGTAKNPDTGEDICVALVALEGSVLRSAEATSAVRLDHTVEEIVALYGDLSGTVGKRVRIDYRGSNPFEAGLARIVSDRGAPGLGRTSVFSSRGFRWARPGGGT